MLIINNGHPKSGSSWMQLILTKSLNPCAPSESFRNKWRNPSVDIDRLEEYTNSAKWMDRDELLKMHFRYTNQRKFLLRSDIFIIITHRNIADSVLSFYYHNLRIGKVGVNDKINWLQTNGRTFAQGISVYRNSWKNIPNALMIRYEDMINKPETEISRVLLFLGKDINNYDIVGLSKTKANPQKNGLPREDSHIRTAGISTAQNEIPAELLNEFYSLEKNTEQ